MALVLTNLVRLKERLQGLYYREPAHPTARSFEDWLCFEIERLRLTVESLRRDIADPPADVQEAVLRKLNLWPLPAPTMQNAADDLDTAVERECWEDVGTVTAYMREALAKPVEPEADPMPDMAHLDAVQLRRIIARHVRFREEAVRLLQQVDTGYEGEWPEIRQFLERVNARLVLAQNRQAEPEGELEALRKERYWLRSALGAIIGLFHDQEHEAKNIARRVLDSTAENRRGDV